MPPRKNAAPSNALRTFFCDICQKGYPRQPDYENHLRSYDHNHRQRLADMKKLTAAQNETSGEKKRGVDDMKAISVDTPEKKVGGGLRFTKVGAPAAGGGASRFKKVGVTVPDANKTEETDKITEAEKKAKDEEEKLLRQQEQVQKRLEELRARRASEKTQSLVPAPAPAVEKAQDEVKEDEDVVMAEASTQQEAGEEITWEQYDFTKPTGCDHASCPGCKVDGIWDDDFEPIAV
ncbi:hypothetical protein K491DRAFT_685671 [Lophiostoma macrostomum CBS 122681]|uniref:C2H2-type domain-containing protein n=1 Tax=Lophiostoma macrostomum CBS 122681 TaxID=1314788 RepID=A0A6A6SM77_9PLEO|nr:hypothetical protein K491DRAFT_685671 [Lophiostoma macrostomum CBS 122681]